MVAARIPMPRAGFDTWLRTPLPGPDAIANPAAMWTGWAADGAGTDWDLTGLAGSPAAAAGIREARAGTPLQRLATRATRGVTVARHHDGALEVYLYDYHGDTYGTQTDLLMLAGAARFATADSPVLHWGGDVYPDLPLNGDPPLAVLLVGPSGARFVARFPLDAPITRLRPVEATFLAAAEASGDTWDTEGLLDAAIRGHATDADRPAVDVPVTELGCQSSAT
ncbi:hypothetical protein Daura_29010 [Dactylosporangium aurantiacum]|uniref:Uncharacterized protein n=1 Tax=Dactylosporangium aurantiacum TaxID=35754 RepID=A0A9Q9ICU5_9ACTN|nr:hypothetical protein [Dactylosporangium aurantiacum]MDG6106694.1 hypothetical protein [Dactylosporangium aurantiacum]UWZ50848.1 hypothetical protein Daura_29010 [Dactylosporangium aurantiacum]